MIGLFRNRARDAILSRLYDEIVAQARQPAFYADHGVPDTLEGRYEMMVLHLFLVMHRFKTADTTARDAAQALCDRFFREMDRAMREMGVGDTSIPKKMRKIAQLYAQRAFAYSETLAQPDNSALADAIGRDVLGKADTPGASGLAAYVRRSIVVLAAVSEMELIERHLVFSDPAIVEEAV